MKRVDRYRAAIDLTHTDPAEAGIYLRVDQRGQKSGARRERRFFGPPQPVGCAPLGLLVRLAAENAQRLDREQFVLTCIAAVLARFRAFRALESTADPDRLPRTFGAGDARQLVQIGADVLADSGDLRRVRGRLSPGISSQHRQSKSCTN